MGQTFSAENSVNGPPRFSRTLPAGLSSDEKKARYEKEITRLMETWPEGGQEKYRAEFKGTEKADFPDNADYTEVSFDQQILIYQVHKDGQNQRLFKKVLRSKPDPWRKIGPMKKLSEIGGRGAQAVPGAPKPRYYEIRAGSTPPADPITKPLLSIDDYKPFGGLSGNSAE